jgi:hypothetical protein
MLLVSIFQLFHEDPDLKHVGMTREDETATLPMFWFGVPTIVNSAYFAGFYPGHASQRAEFSIFHC